MKKLPISDKQILQKHHKFIRQDDDQPLNYRPNNDQYQELIAKQYYQKLYKEYAIVDLTMFQEGKIGCRWRTQKQVIVGKGETICGAKKCQQKGSETYQINFAYVEDNQKKNALVKVRVCTNCGLKLNYKKSHVKIQG